MKCLCKSEIISLCAFQIDLGITILHHVERKEHVQCAIHMCKIQVLYMTKKPALALLESTFAMLAV